MLPRPTNPEIRPIGIPKNINIAGNPIYKGMKSLNIVTNNPDTKLKQIQDKNTKKKFLKLYPRLLATI